MSARTSARDRLHTWRPDIRHAEPRPGEALPPGPRAPRAWQSLRVWATRNTYFPALRRRHGDTFSVHAAPVGRIVVLTAPSDVRAVTMGGPATCPVGEGNALFEPLLGRRSVLGLDGAEHTAERRRMMPALHGERLAGVVSLMRGLAEEEVASWPVDRDFPLVDRMRDLTLKVIIRVVLGVEERDRADRLVAALRRVVDIGTLDLFMWKWPWLTRIGPWRRAVRDLDRADDLLFAEIARRRRDPDRRTRPDVLSMLLDGEPDDDLVRSEVVTLLTGGHETTAVATAWMFERLLRHPAALARVRAGLDRDDDEFRAAVIKETLRLRQVSYNVGRRIAEPVEAGGYRLPAGTFVWPSLAAIHTHHGTWGADAERFRPERWLEPDPPTRAYLPFGGGAHRCLGAMFALTEMDVILRTVLRAVDLRPVGARDERGVMRNIIMVPSRGARVRVAWRMESS
ncbi:cytochrome P450 [Actinoplanes sp. NPDC049668]|uniref:cytochrome P450 n=1 Tax=unclassified Actinoplanes TaxID=2626549 RepID=UPI0033A45996